MAPYPDLHTDRLILKRVSLEDAPQIQRLFPRWEIIQYLSNRVPWPYPDNGAEDFLKHVALPSIEAGNLLAWTLRLRTDPDNLIGQINLRPNSEKHRGFWLAPEFQGQGYMTEATHAVTDYWFEVLDKEVMRVTKAIGNTRSIKVSKRTGMQMVGYTVSDFASGEQQKTEIWELTREAWLLEKEKQLANQ